MKSMFFGALALAAFMRPAAAADYNQYVLEAVQSMPEGGRYSKLDEATQALGRSISLDRGLLLQNPLAASPVYCSGASYEAFIEVVSRLQREGKLHLSEQAANGLLVNMQPDGTDPWGRWNSNGPGTSRFFYELNLGPNFMSWRAAKPGDFLKIFFSEEIGQHERGHSTVYLGSFRKNGEDYFRYWSSNAPAGRGVYEMPKSRAVRVIFSRLENPENLNHIPLLPKSDPYLTSMLTTSSTLAEMKKKIGL